MFKLDLEDSRGDRVDRSVTYNTNRSGSERSVNFSENDL